MGLGEIGEDAVVVQLLLELGQFGRPLVLHDFDDLHGGLEAGGGGGVLVAENVSKSVDCQAGEVTEFVEKALGPGVPGFEEHGSESGVVAGPIVYGGPVDAGAFGGSGDGLPGDEGLEDVLLYGVEGVENR